VVDQHPRVLAETPAGDHGYDGRDREKPCRGVTSPVNQNQRACSGEEGRHQHGTRGVQEPVAERRRIMNNWIEPGEHDDARYNACAESPAVHQENDCGEGNAEAREDDVKAQRDSHLLTRRQQAGRRSGGQNCTGAGHAATSSVRLG
jgi:hypothetical protein